MASGNFNAKSGGLTLAVSWRSISSPITNSSTISVSADIVHKSAVGAKSGHTIKCGTQSRTFSSPSMSAKTIETSEELFSNESFVINHDNDGTKKVTLTVTFKMNSNYDGTYIGTITASKEITLDTIPRQSSIASLTSSVEVNGSNAVNLTLNRGNTSYKHTVTFGIGDYSHTIEGVGTSTSYIIPKGWLFAVPKSSGTATVEVVTYSGEAQIGDIVYASFTLVVPEDIVPVIGDILWTKTSSEPNSWPMTQNVSQGVLSMEGTHGVYGSTITSYELEFAGLRSTSSKLTVNNIQHSGSQIMATAKIIDSRGRSAEKQVAFNVHPYSKPTLTVSVYRCNADGSENPLGEYMYVKASVTISFVEGKNTLKSLKLGYKQHSAFDYTEKDLTSGVDVWFEASSNYSWDWYITAADVVHSVTETGLMSTGAVVLDIFYNGKGIGIGKVAEGEGFDSAWAFQENGEPMMDYVVETGTDGFFHYKKWKSGNVDCYGISEEETFAISDVFQEKMYYSNATLSLPAGLFQSVSYANVAIISTYGFLNPQIKSLSKDSIGLFVSNISAGAVKLKFSVEIKGKWK